VDPNAPIPKPPSQNPVVGPSQQQLKRFSDIIDQKIERLADKLITSGADLAARTALRTAIAVAPFIPLARLGIPSVMRGGKTPLPGALIVGFPAGYFLQKAVISENGDIEIGGDADAVIARTIAKAEEYAKEHQKKPTGPPMHDADP